MLLNELSDHHSTWECLLQANAVAALAATAALDDDLAAVVAASAVSIAAIRSWRLPGWLPTLGLLQA